MSPLRSFQNTGLDLFVSGLNNSHSGNLSIRNNRMLTITRSGAMLHRLEYTDLVETLIDGDDSETVRASREIPVHRAIYKYTKAEAIAHSHPPHIIALSMQCERITPVDAEGVYFFQKGVPVIGVTNSIASDEVAEKIVPMFEQAPLVVVRGHGVFAIGKDLEECLHWSSSLEHSAKIILLNNQFAINPNFK
ncbi:MAG: class II aldolase/adducin family protein [Candidatus Rifleibacteriota bacterium]